MNAPRFEAICVESILDYDHGEGWLAFEWNDPLYGTEGLTIDINGHCSRNMSIRSGEGWGQFDFTELRRDSVQIHFASRLAAKLELPEVIEIGFNLADDEFAELQRAVNWFNS